MNLDQTFAIAYGKNKKALHWRQTSVTWGEILGWLESPGDRKDIEGYVLGTLQPTTRMHKVGDAPCLEMHRVKDGIVSRSMLALDVDHPGPGFLDQMELVFPHAAIMHTTFSSAPDDRRYRLLIPTDREMAPDEYITAANTIIQRLDPDHEQFDPSSPEPHRFMYKPSAQQPDWFQSWVYEGGVAVVDDLLEGFDADLSKKPLPAPSKTKRDPFEIDGAIGAFNRAYEDWDLLIAEYDLPYEKIDDTRYHLIGAKSEAGMGPIDGVPGFVYSHHSHDPAFGKTCSAFDLVRLHRFGELDENQPPQTPVNRLPSHRAMLAAIATDYRVTAQIVGVDFDAVMDDDVAVPNEWKLKLRLNRNSKFLDHIQNWDLIFDNDPAFAHLVYNELTLSPEATTDLPWRAVVPGVTSIITDNDRWEAVHYIEREYDYQVTRTRLDGLINARAGRKIVNPVRDYLKALQWDGKPRVEMCLPGVRPTPHTRLIARKVMVAAVARMMDPGVKWDHTLVLYGLEGLGKTHWINKVSRGYSSTLGRIGEKDTLLSMQRSWIMVSDEGHSLRKGDADLQKEFLTRTEDLFRMPYDRETLLHKRHCVIWSTTNDETFLRRQEGNRRFLIVDCQDRVNFDELTDEYIDQLWAEAMHLYLTGERLWLSDLESEDARAERERFVEEDVGGGMIEEYLDRLVTADWWEKSPEWRQQWLLNQADGFEVVGTETIDRVCSVQIWVEAMGRRKGDARRVDLLDISNALKRLPGWRALPGRQRLPGYGPQLVYVRDELL